MSTLTMNTQPKKRGRPVGSKTIKKVQKSLEEMNTSQKEIMDKIYKVHADNWKEEWDEIEVPLLRRIEKPKMSLPNKITLVLTVVNVAILITLIIINL